MKMNIACIPAYNEEKVIGSLVSQCLKYVDKVIVCNDGSTDDTEKIAIQNGADVISHDTNQGYGSAIISLFDEARKINSDVTITIDGDGQHDPKQIPILIDAMQKNNIDVIIGSRFLDDTTKSKGYRKTGIKVITKVSNMETKLNVSDAQSGFRAYSNNAIKQINPTEKGMSISTEILQKISNKSLTLAEVPITVSYGEDTSTENPVPHGVSVLANTLKFISVKHPILFYGIPGVALLISGLLFGFSFLDNYLNTNELFLGSLFGSIILILLGSILCATSVILFSMSVLVRDRN